MITIREQIVAEAMSWLKTPYHAHGRIKGQGVDCGMFLVEVFERTKLIKPYDPGEYARDWHIHHSEELFLQKIEEAGGHKVDGPPQPGDIAMFRYGRCASHGSIVIKWPLVIHAYVGLGVTLDNAENGPLRGRFVGAYSPLTGGE